MKYIVTAERGESTRRWVLQSVDVPGAISEVTRLDQAEEHMREAIAFVAEVRPDDIEIEVRPVVRSLDGARAHWAQAERLRAEAAGAQREAAREARAAAQTLADAGLSVRDIGTVLGVSHQRAHQLLDA